MVKKQEKITKEKIPLSTSSSEHDAIAEEKADTELYVCSGSFKTDFETLCKQAEFPYVPQILLLPCLPNRNDQKQQQTGNFLTVAEERNKSSRMSKKDIRLVATADREVVNCPAEKDGSDESSPKTFVVRTGRDYFKPCIRVESTDQDNMTNITEVCIKSWLIDSKMLTILHQCFTAQNKLHTLNLWRVGFDDSTLEQLSCYVNQSTSLKALILDNNPIESQDWNILLGPRSQIQFLSLRHNKITSEGCRKLGISIGCLDGPSNLKLISLNLSGNEITNKGVEYLADGLKLNRTLLCLDVSCNLISNIGICKLAQVISQYPMTHDEVVFRRKLIWESMIAPIEGEGEERPTSVTSTSASHIVHKSRTPLKSSSKKTSDSKTGKDDIKKHKQKDINEKSNKDGLKPGSKKSKDFSKDTRTSELLEEEVPSTYEEMKHPLLFPIEYIQNTPFIRGNFNLISLNLSNNHIDEEGFSYLLNSLKYQSEILKKSQEGKTGLLRVVLEVNEISSEQKIFMEIKNILIERDPFKPSNNTSV